MNILTPSSVARTANRSIGLKLSLLAILALLLMLPAWFVSNLVDERAERARSVAKDIAATQGGEQMLLGPTMVVPYTLPNPDPIGGTRISGLFYISPISAKAEVRAQVSERHRSLFKVPVYIADVVFDADFDLRQAMADAPSGASFDWQRAEIVLGVADVRGAQDDATLFMRGELQKAVASAPAPSVATTPLAADILAGGSAKFAPSQLFSKISMPTTSSSLTPIGVALGPSAGRMPTIFHATAKLKLGGASRLSVLPYGRSTEVKMSGDWANPGFVGGFLPVERAISDQGFTARWSVPYIARGLRANSAANDYVDSLGSKELAVNFVEIVDPYQSVGRALKYALLFIGMVFLTYFLFEALGEKRLHPAQYLLIGLAQLVFYLLLLSISERVGFDWAFLLAAAATVSLISLYAYWSFESRRRGYIALSAFAPLYLLIYLLMRMEDQALLIGSLCSFAVIAATMFFTRRIDWSSSPQASAAVAAETSDAPPRPEA